MFSYRGIENKIYVSASNITDNVKSIDRLFDIGVAGVITKTISPVQNCNSSEKVWKQNNTIYNSTQYSSRSILSWVEILNNYANKGKLVIPSIFAPDDKELLKLAQTMQEVGVEAIELGISCPNDNYNNINITKSMEKLKQKIHIPLYVKLNAMNLKIEMLKELEKQGVNGIVLSDSFPIMCWNGYDYVRAGMSGEAIREDVIASIKKARYQGIKCEIVGTGGIYEKEHIAAYLAAGADAVGICSCLYVNGLEYANSLF